MITGITAGDVLISIDRRPINGFLYGLAYNPTPGTVTLYSIHPTTNVAVPVGTSGTFVDSGGTPVPIGEGTNTTIAIDFNPTVDRLRVVTSNGQNFRMNANTGAFVDGDLGGAAGSVAGLNMDGFINGATTHVQALAYVGSRLNATATTLYTLDQLTSTLAIQSPANAGTQGQALSLSPAISAVLGFDIPPTVTVNTSNTPVASGTGFAVVKLMGQSTEVLAQVNLADGMLHDATPIGSGGVIGLALQQTPSLPIVGLAASGTTLIRFEAASPGITVSVTITGVVAGETIVGVDFRPATGQLFGFGVNATANTATLYRLDPQTGAATVVGTANQIAFVDGAGNPVDFPAAGTGWGFAFNPTTDRVRVVTSTSLNFRANPNTGAPVDGDLGGTAGSVAGINPDGTLNGATTSATGLSYTDAVGGAPLTTLYTIDAGTNAFYLQSPANSGTTGHVLPVTLTNEPLDFTAPLGFAVSRSVRAPAANAPVTEGTAFAALTATGSTHLYTIDLTTGAATDLGTISAGTQPLAGLAIGQTAVH